MFLRKRRRLTTASTGIVVTIILFDSKTLGALAPPYKAPYSDQARNPASVIQELTAHLVKLGPEALGGSAVRWDLRSFRLFLERV